MKETILKLLLLLSILSFIEFAFAESTCIVPYPQNVETTPIYAKIFGKYTLYLPYNGKELELHEGEIIQAYCRTNFSSISYNGEKRNRYGYLEQYRKVLKNQTSISLQCLEGNLHINKSMLEEKVLECTKLNWSVYDANEPYQWCEENQNAQTLLLAAKSNQDHHILAGICFNINEWSLRTITYNVTNPGVKYNKEMERDITKTLLKSDLPLGGDLSNLRTNYFDLTDYDLQQQLTEISKTNSWLNLATYEISPIVQGDSYENYFSEYDHILNMIWWRNLRLGNWKLFTNTLENYAYNNSFQIYTGTSGVVKVPINKIPSDNVLVIKNGYLNETVPGYIWTYLTSTDNLNEDFIIVGYNSPFAEWFSEDDVVFCPNICAEIPWLKEINSSFRYATAGKMFCCSPDYLRDANNLQGFPIDVLITRATQKQLNANVESTEQTYTTDANDAIMTLNVK